MKSFIIWLSSSLFLIGMLACSSEPVIQPVSLKPRTLPAPKIQEPKREPGSLWSELSKWNEIYTPRANRGLGDVLLVKLGDRFRNYAVSKFPPPTEAELNYLAEVEKKKKQAEEEAKAQKEKDAKEAKKGGNKNSQDRAPASVDDGTASDAKNTEPNAEAAVDESKLIEAQIREVMPQGTYHVYGSQKLMIKGRETLVTFEGYVRDRDVESDDTFSSDSILNLKMDIAAKPNLPEVQR